MAPCPQRVHIWMTGHVSNSPDVSNLPPINSLNARENQWLILLNWILDVMRKKYPYLYKPFDI